MPAYVHVRVHLIWSTKYREPRISPEWQDELYRYLYGICENLNCKLLVAGGVTDHLHTYVGIPATLSIADLVNAMKSNSSRWIHEKFDPAFAWQTKYAAFSVSKSVEDQLFAYIRNQQEHHRHRSFRDELVEFLERHEMEWDERYLLE